MQLPPWLQAALGPDGGLTPRAVGVGLLLGTLMCLSNTVFGLQTGFVTMASLQSALLAHGLFALFARVRPSTPPLTVAEHVLLTSVSTAAATMPLAGGFVGILPALRILSQRGEAGPGPLPLQSASEQIAFCLSVCLLGVFVAVPLRGYLLTLRFPSGTATAVAIHGLRGGGGLDSKPSPQPRVRTRSTLASQVQPPLAASSTSMDGEEGEKPATPASPVPTPPPASLRAALIAFAASACLAVAGFFIPVLNGVPAFSAVGLPTVTAWSWVFTLSLSYLGQGMIMGLNTCVSMFAGSIIAWGIIGPYAATQGWVVNPLSSSPTGGRGFLLWISLSILVSEAMAGVVLSFVSLFHAAVSLEADPARALLPSDTLGGGYDERQLEGGVHPDPDIDGEQDKLNNASRGEVNEAPLSSPLSTVAVSPSSLEVLPTSVWVSGLVATSAIAVFALIPLAHISFEEAALAVAASLPISIIAVKCLGQTDLNPVSGLGKLTQVAFGVLFPANLVGNVIAGAVAEAGAQQAGDLLQDLKMGLLLKVPLPAQFIGQCVGSLFSVFASVAAFALLDAAYGVPSASLPAPTAGMWVAMAELMSGGELPIHVLPYVIGFGGAAFLLTLLTSFAEGGGGPGAPTKLQVLARRVAPYLPSPTAFSIGFYVTANWAIPRLCGALFAALLVRRGSSAQQVVLIATGLVLGEGIAALFTASLAMAGARPLTCAGCAIHLCGNWCP